MKTKVPNIDGEKRKKVEQRRGQKRTTVLDELNDLKEQKKRMKSNIEALFKSAYDLAEKAESTGKVTFISRSNRMRRSATEKEGELKSIEEEINKKLEALKD